LAETTLESSPLPLNPLIGDVLTGRPMQPGMPTGPSNGEPETAILRRVRAASDPTVAVQAAAAEAAARTTSAGARGTS
jgi:hypothetical protein